MPTCPKRNGETDMTDQERGTLGLGGLEAAIMEVVWAIGSTTVREVLGDLQRSPAPGYTTVATVMNRLVEKGILQRRRPGKTATYQAAASRDEYVRKLAASTVERLVNECGELALVQFASALEQADPKRLAAVRRRLAVRETASSDA